MKKLNKLRLFALVITSFVVIGFSLYINSFNNEFIWDDDDSIVNNIYIKDFKYLPNYFSENLIAGSGQITNYWRPVLLISFALDFKIYNLNPLGFHLTNTLLHILVAILAFFLLYNLTKKNFLLSYLPSLLFLIHPLQTEAITYIAGRADPLSSVFVILSLIFYTTFRKNLLRKNLILSFVFFILGLLTKEQVILLPILIFLIEFCFFSNKEDWKKNLKIPIYFLLISVLYFLARITFLNFNDILSGVNYLETYNTNLWSRLLTFTWVMIKYFSLLFFPFNLHMAYEVTPITSVLSPSVFLFIFLILFILWIIYKTWKKNRLIAFGFLWFFIILLPRTNIISINRPLYEHWLYLPMLGFWLAIIALIILMIEKINNLRKQKIVKLILLTFFIIFSLYLSILTVNRNKDWKNPITFYENNLKYTPNSFIQKNNLGMAYAKEGRHEEAIIQYREAINILDFYPQIHFNLANSLITLNKTEEAEKEYLRAIEISPEFIMPYSNLIILYTNQGEKEKISTIINLIKENFAPENYYKLLLSTYLSFSDYQEAINLTEFLIKKYPENVDLKNILLDLKLNNLVQ